MDKLTKKYTNNTLEEQLRVTVCEQLKKINSLTNEVDMLRNEVKNETTLKYEAYKKIAELTSKLNRRK